ncbi:endothelin-converting enzyme homolog isoform X2 [Centruroides vittatus]|uniref:endothelin-converting enzyme homolog isoform X2 n=1 Tax=Centruroides vittatus TaxID=120091 RepID=UPI00351030D6
MMDERYEGKYSFSRKTCILTSVCFCWSPIAFIVVFVLFLFYGGLLESSFMCISVTCIDVASYLLLSMNKSINPCENFYSYACGNYFINREFQRGISNKIIEQQKTVDNKLIDLFNNNMIDSILPVSQKALSYYKFCFRSDERNETKYTNYLINNLGSMPCLKNWKKTGFLFHSVSLATRLSKHGLFEFGVTLNEKTKTENIMMIKRVPIDDVINNTVSLLASKCSEELGIFEIKKLKMLDKAVNFEKEKHPYDLLEVITVKEFSERTGFNEWIEFIKIVMKDVLRTVTENDLIAVYNINYFINLFNIIKNENIDERTISNYVVYQAITYFNNYMDKYGLNKKYSTANKCISLLKDLMPLYVDHLYTYKIENQLNIIKNMIEFIKDALKNLISNASWIDETARMSLIKKVRKMKFLSGYNPKVRDIQYVNEYYKFIPKPTNDSNLNVLYISFIRNFIRFSQMNALVNRTRWPDYSITNVRIYKEEKENVIGSTRDKNGVLRDWWTNKSKEQFRMKLVFYEIQFIKHCCRKG